MRISLLIILLLLMLMINFRRENYTEDKVIIPNNLSNENLNINLDKTIIRKMYNMANFINGDEFEPEIYGNLPSNYKKRSTYIQILYEMYVIDFLDKYLINRFDAYKFLNITYKYPSYKNINDKYPDDKVAKNYDKIFDDFLLPSINYLYNNINSNIDIEFFKFTINDLNNNNLSQIKNEFEKLDPNNLKDFMKNYFNSYIISVLKKLNVIMIDICNKNEMQPFTFSFIEITKENTNEIIELIDDIINNESLFFNL